MAYPVTSPKQKTSGWRTKARPNHTGTDFGWHVGGVTYPRDVFAISDGTVKTGSESRAGNYVNLYSGNKRWLYGHLASISVKNGQTVKEGQKLGVMGQTGAAQGVHLHLSLYINGVESNPELHITIAKEDTMSKFTDSNLLNRLVYQTRGRYATPAEYKRDIGKPWQAVVKTWLDFRVDLPATLKKVDALEKSNALKDKEILALKTQLEQDNTEVNVLGRALLSLLNSLGYKKA